MQAALDAAERGVGDLGDLLVAQALGVPQPQHCAMLVRDGASGQLFVRDEVARRVLGDASPVRAYYNMEFKTDINGENQLYKGVPDLVGPGCADFDGFGGRNTLTASGLGQLDGGADAGSRCEVAFVAPVPADGGSGLSLSGADDIDGEACGETYTARVTVRSNAALVRLFVNDNPLAGLEPSQGVAVFDAELGNRGERSNVLRAEAVGADGERCSAVLSDVRVDCPGPSCSIDSPRASRDGFLGQSLDSDADSSCTLPDARTSPAGCSRVATSRPWSSARPAT